MPQATDVITRQLDHLWALVEDLLDIGRITAVEMVLPFVFDVFDQARQGLGRPWKGLGMGLNLVERLVELHGGTVSVENRGPQPGAHVHGSISAHGSPGAVAEARSRPRP